MFSPSKFLRKYFLKKIKKVKECQMENSKIIFNDAIS